MSLFHFLHRAHPKGDSPLTTNTSKDLLAMTNLYRRSITAIRGCQEWMAWGLPLVGNLWYWITLMGRGPCLMVCPLCGKR